MTTMQTDVPIQLTLRGAVPRGQVAYAMKKIEHAFRRPPAPIRQVQVIITAEPNPAYERPIRIEVDAIAAGRPIRAHVQATEVNEAADLVVDRLQQRIERVREQLRTSHRRAGNRTAPRRNGHDLPRPATLEPDEGRRQVVKRKTYALEPMTAEQAAEEMEFLDHDFYLYVDAGSAADALVYRRGDGTIGVLEPTGGTPPTLTKAQAKARLDLTTDRFVFYRDPADSRGRVLYRRYDGRYGLIVAS